MTIELPKQTRTEAIASLRRYFETNLDPLNELPATLLLDFILEEIAPAIYNQAIHDAQTNLTARLADLPGVGHFRSTQLLHDLELTAATRASIARGTPFLGICVGLQWLYEGSTEASSTDGLCHFSSLCERFPTHHGDTPLKSPHVGWNSLDDLRPDSRLLRGIPPGAFVYYTHSWRAPVSADTAATTTYGTPFTAAVERDNVFGVQFHPEKSATTGLHILQNFLAL